MANFISATYGGYPKKHLSKTVKQVNTPIRVVRDVFKMLSSSAIGITTIGLLYSVSDETQLILL